MPEQRSLTLRIRIDNRTIEQEDQVIAKVKERLAEFPGEPRPELELARASRESIAVTP